MYALRIFRPLLAMLLCGLVLSGCGLRRLMRDTEGYRLSPIVALGKADGEGISEPLCSLADPHLPESWSARMSHRHWESGSLDDSVASPPEDISSRAEQRFWLVLECKAKGPEQAADSGTLAQLLAGLTTELEHRLREDGFTVSRESGSFRRSLVYARPGGIDGRAKIYVSPLSTGSRRDGARSTPEASVEFRIEVYEGTWDYAGPNAPSPTPHPTVAVATASSTRSTPSLPPDLALTATALYEALNNTPVPPSDQP